MAASLGPTPAPTPGPRLLEDLLREVYERPDDDAPRAVLADFLMERGDPRGELIALQLRPELDDASRARLSKLLAAHARGFLGRIDAFVPKSQLELARGFPVACRVAFRKEADVRACGAAPEWATIERLSHVVPSPIPADQARWIFWIDPRMRSLREVDVHDASIGCLTAAAQPWLIERLDASQVRDRDAFDALATTDRLPHLRAVVLGDPPRSFVPRLQRAQAIREIVLRTRSEPRWEDWLSQAEGLPGVERLVYENWARQRVELRRGADGALSETVGDVIDLLATVVDGLPPATLTGVVVRPNDAPRAAPLDATAVGRLLEAARQQTRLRTVDLTGVGGELHTLHASSIAPGVSQLPEKASLREVRALTWPMERTLIALDEGRVVRVDLPTATPTTMLETRGGLLAASGGAGLFAVVDGGPVFVGDLEGNRRHRLDAHLGNGRLLCFSADGHRLLTASGDTNHQFLCLWDLATGRCLSQRPIADGCYTMLWLAGETHVLMARPRKKALLAPVDPQGRARSVDIDYFGRAAVAADGTCAFASRETLLLTDAQLRPIARHPLAAFSHGLAFLADGRLAYLDDGRLLTCDRAGGRPKVLLESSELAALSAAPDGASLAVALGGRIEFLTP